MLLAEHPRDQVEGAGVEDLLEVEEEGVAGKLLLEEKNFLLASYPLPD